MNLASRCLAAADLQHRARPELTRKTTRAQALRGLIPAAVRAAVQDDIATRAAALAFFTVLSLSPLLVLTLYGTTLLGLDARAGLVEQVQRVVGARAAETVDQLVGSASVDAGLGRLSAWLSLALLAITSTAVFAQLQRALNHVWGATARPPSWPLGWLRRRLVSFAMIAVLGTLLVASLVANTLVDALLRTDGAFAGVATQIISGVLVAVAFMLLYRLVPDAIVAWRDALVGGVVTAALFEVGTYGIGIWLGQSGLGAGYGPAGSVVVLLVWIYYSAIVALFGAELTQAWSNALGSGIVPKAFDRPKGR